MNPVYGWQEREAYKARFADLPGEVVVPVADRAAMRARTGDPRLVPDGGSGRVMLDDGYLEVFDRDHVSLVELADLAHVGPGGLELVDGTVVGLDVLVVTDDFDAGPPAATLLDIGVDSPGFASVVAPRGGTAAVDLQRSLGSVVERLAG